MSTPSLVEDIFLAALEKGTPEERAAYLEEACKDDPDLRRRVERLLEAHPKAGNFLEPPAKPSGEETGAFVPAGATADHAAATEQAGVMLAGRYKLIEAIGEGGMGSVWMAQQQAPVKRLVAVKVIKAGMDSKAVQARFEAERQALAVMDHPNVAKVLDAGATPDSRPFFVMELVKGVPITTFCDERKLTPRERLELFVPVCQAIQHAHQKGVIHRDIKPSNVLVALYDDKPVPKVIDFGVAKATGQPLTEKTLATGFGAIVGTPEYMSPEQASFNNLDIDTRSDVYALGVLLYELLAGSPPFSRQALEKAGLLEMLRVVREVEPSKPSTRLSTAEALPTLSANRGTEPARLTRLVRGEMDWIVMKALEKDRARRYDTATGFAADVQRYLAGEPVQAVPPSAAYRLRKFVRKHRVTVTTVVAFAGLLIAAAVVSSWLAVKATRAEALAEERQKEAEASAKEATAGKLVAIDAQFETLRAKAKSDLYAQSLQVDLDLFEWRSDPRTALLRLARPPKHQDDSFAMKYHFAGGQKEHEVKPMNVTMTSPEFTALREFVTAAVLTAGQDYAPLLPPITHDGHEVSRFQLSPGRQTLLTLGTDGTARLWDVRASRPIAPLRRGTERVVNGGFSSDGKTVFTDDVASTARFWDASTGAYRAAIAARPNRYDLPDGLLFAEKGSVPFTYADAVRITATRLLTKSFFANGKDEGVTTYGWKGPVELWDTATGKLVARLDQAGLEANKFRFLGDGQWVTATENDTTVVVFSAKDGKLVGRLAHPDGESVTSIAASPDGRKLTTIVRTSPDKYLLRLWDAETWKADTPVAVNGHVAHFFTDELLGIQAGRGFGGEVFSQVRRIGPFTSSIDLWSEICLFLLPAGDLVLTDNETVLDTKTGQRLVPPPGRKFHPSMSKFAADGRFVVAGQSVADTLVDKSLPALMWLECGHQPGFGYLTPVQGSHGVEVRLLPTAALKDVPPELLELWAQVAVRGELDAEGRFVKWKEDTWERKRQELAVKPAPYPDVPFPGYVATDKLHWLRREYAEASDADKPRLAKQLLDRAEAARDKNEAVRWRAVLGKQAK